MEKLTTNFIKYDVYGDKLPKNLYDKFYKLEEKFGRCTENIFYKLQKERHKYSTGNIYCKHNITDIRKQIKNLHPNVYRDLFYQYIKLNKIFKNYQY